MKNLGNIAAMLGFFFCSYLGWLIFKQKHDQSYSSNQGGIFGVGGGGFGQNYNAPEQPNPGFVPFAGRGVALE